MNTENQPKDTTELTSLPYMTLDNAIGTIEAKEHQQERLEELTDRLRTGEFHVETEITLPCGCMDGRCGCTIKPNTAGGTLSIFVADDLTTKRFAGEDDSTLEGYKNIVQLVKASGHKAGGHDETYDSGAKTGCGASDRLELIYGFMATDSEVLRDIALELGIEVSDDEHDSITNAAAERTNFSSSKDLLKVIADDPEIEVDHARGKHNEVIAIINTKEGTTLDRDALEAEFGPDYEAFNVDVWSFEAAAELTSISEEEAKQKFIAMVYYNLATSHVLCGKKMRVIVL